MKISASILYNFVKCPHRVYRDAFDDQSLKEPPNEFVQLLWDKGVRYECEVIGRQKGEIEILDLSGIPRDARFAETLKAMKNRTPYIYQGSLEIDELLGCPDLLELQPNGEYIPIDIKSGMGFEGEDDESEGKLKKHYAVQIGLYVDALIRLGFLSQNLGKILDSSGVVVDYDLSLPQGVKNKQTWWEFYVETLAAVRNIYSKHSITEPALGSECKLCDWYTDCKNTCVSSDCLSLIPELGRSRKAALKVLAKNFKDLSKIELSNFIAAKNQYGIKGIGEPTFEKMKLRAGLLASGKKDPLILQAFNLPQKPIEIFFDIETDPTQNILYLHGVVERRQDRRENVFYAFTARDVSDREERRAWADCWAYIRSLPKNDWAMYYYSKYERTQYRVLAAKYPDVASIEEVEWLFDPQRSIDLYYDVIKKYTEWPTYNYSVKTLAQHLGFNWRDENPSGAASIQWFNEWCESKDAKILQRILDYNEDDCKAMIIVKDKLSSLIS
ncbi:MAG: TM0106 family RecB-like putative nuclease [Candidatus Omnitrophota bacterium]